MRRTASTQFIYGIDRIIHHAKLEIIRKTVAQGEKMREYLFILSILRIKD